MKNRKGTSKKGGYRFSRFFPRAGKKEIPAPRTPNPKRKENFDPLSALELGRTLVGDGEPTAKKTGKGVYRQLWRKTAPGLDLGKEGAGRSKLNRTHIPPAWKKKTRRNTPFRGEGASRDGETVWGDVHSANEGKRRASLVLKGGSPVLPRKRRFLAMKRVS